MSFAPTDTLLDEILEFLASTPTPERIIAYKPPDALQQRLSDLLAKNKTVKLTKDEQIIVNLAPVLYPVTKEYLSQGKHELFVIE